MEQALIALIGILVGILLNEYFRRSNRIEVYSAKVFEKRLEVYEGLMKKICEAEADINDLLEGKSLPTKDLHNIAFEAGLRVMDYTEEHSFYLNDEIIVHAGAAFVGTGDFVKMRRGKERDDAISHFRKMLAGAKDMIRAESGMKEIDEAFRAVTKAKHTSPVIEYYRTLKQKHDRDDKRV